MGTINPLFTDRNNGIEFGNPTEAPTEWHKKVGIVSSLVRTKMNRIFLNSEYYSQLNEIDQRKVRTTGQYLQQVDNETQDFWLMHFPNGTLRIERQYGHLPVFFPNKEYTKLIEKPVKPADCHNKSCKSGWITNMGTSYPCSMCTAQEEYKIQLKTWQQQSA